MDMAKSQNFRNLTQILAKIFATTICNTVHKNLIVTWSKIKYESIFKGSYNYFGHVGSMQIPNAHIGLKKRLSLLINRLMIKWKINLTQLFKKIARKVPQSLLRSLKVT